jgi:hypothetical protein
MSNLEKQIAEIIGACNASVCDNANHIAKIYNSQDPFDCVDQMTDVEWTTWTGQPGTIRKVYHKIMTLPKNQQAAGLVQLQFGINADKLWHRKVATLLHPV